MSEKTYTQNEVAKYVSEVKRELQVYMLDCITNRTKELETSMKYNAISFVEKEHPSCKVSYNTNKSKVELLADVRKCASNLWSFSTSVKLDKEEK